jgi:hypothetical protein
MNEGLIIGHAMAEVAANNAGELWKKEAFYAFKQYAMQHSHFTTEEVRAANPDLPPPPDDRAWGSIALRAGREGMVVGSGWVRSSNRSAHGRVVTMWQSLIFKPTELIDGNDARR